MKIKLNGELKDFPEKLSLQDVILSAKLSHSYFVVAVNFDCVPAQQYEEFFLKEGDEVEILSPMQGG